MVSNFMNAGHDMTKVSGSLGQKMKWEMDGYFCYFADGNRGDCRHPLYSEAYYAWHHGYSIAEDEDKE